MALQAKTIKSKIRAVGNVRKITQAMEKVAAVKMNRVLARTLAARDYALQTYRFLISLVQHRHLHHLFFSAGPGMVTLIVAVASNRGLSGSVNTQLFRTLAERRREHPDEQIEMIAVGRKSEQIARRLGITVIARFTSIPDSVHTRDILPVVKAVSDAYTSGRYSNVMFLYTRFVSALSSEAVLRQALPLDRVEMSKAVEKLAPGMNNAVGARAFSEYTFDPGEESVLDFVTPKILEIKLYKVFLEARLSEHSGRMVAMKNASENARDIIDRLTINYNRARQDGITREISEIAAGAAALNA